MKKIVLGGLEGRMGSFLVEALKEEEDICLVAGISEKENFEGEVPIYSDINQVVNEVNFDIYVDFTIYPFAKMACEVMLKAKKAVIIGTTGFNKADLDYLKQIAKEYGGKGVIAPNFSIGAILINKFTEIKTNVINKITELKTNVSTKFDSLLTPNSINSSTSSVLSLISFNFSLISVSSAS